MIKQITELFEAYQSDYVKGKGLEKFLDKKDLPDSIKTVLRSAGIIDSDIIDVLTGNIKEEVMYYVHIRHSFIIKADIQSLVKAANFQGMNFMEDDPALVFTEK